MGYDEQLSAARFRAERDLARQECERLRARLRDSVPREAYERERAAWLRHIRECETALHRRREYVKKLENAALERRTVRAEDREAAEWARDHGGLERVKWLLDWLLSHDSKIEQLDFDYWLSGRVMHELGFDGDMADRDEVERRLAARLVPEGMEWPCFDDGEPVRIGDVVSDIEVRSVVFRDGGILLSDCTSVPGWGTWRSYKEPIKRPAPEVLDADGVEIREKHDVWWICEGDERGVHAERLRVETILPDGLVECSPYNGGTWVSLEPSELYVNKPVPASDGKPLREGETVWDVDGRGPFAVWSLPEKSGMHASLKKDGAFYYRHPEKLTHERPDSWERLEEDAEKSAREYFVHMPCGCETSEMLDETVETRNAYKARDLVRRAKKLAERRQ